MVGEPMKVRFKLRLVPKIYRPLGRISHAEKLALAKAFLQGRRKYILDPGTPKPGWGIPHAIPEESRLMKEVMEADRRRK